MRWKFTVVTHEDGERIEIACCQDRVTAHRIAADYDRDVGANITDIERECDICGEMKLDCQEGHWIRGNGFACPDCQDTMEDDDQAADYGDWAYHNGRAA
jgi:hypothetical protein